MKRYLLALLMLINGLIGYGIGWVIGNKIGVDYGVATTHVIMETDAANRGYGGWVVKNIDGKPTAVFEWKQ